jgi:hypothetical protein
MMHTGSRPTIRTVSRFDASAALREALTAQQRLLSYFEVT